MDLINFLILVRYELPKLPYGYDELEPFIDSKTMWIHHQKHHQAYVDGLNHTLDSIGASSHPKYISSILSDLKSIPESFRTKVSFFGGGHENHKLFWEIMTPQPDKSPGGKLEDSIDIYFDGFENFKRIFSKKALEIQGSGWCWLVLNPTYNKIEILTTVNQDSPWIFQKTPLLGLDLWEHAFYLHYQYKKSEYVKAWWDVVNWDYVANRFSELFE